ncbi:hypothetical protein HYH03_017930 [Edaphochlamys debaryana]|uniref:Histone deacetylase domain-containing protein n=1 Tax=Edaphochlamys debaryana TaxID=47281 RepID=A0A835XH13_9CHLO|nr:hypothetical protein HYH03_017930 [Edaphochlamys debaryana]|eukprot:KAG2483195.1 hypothetical protein HYH03_017930 [Edaphochlamys debaryana]
MSANNTRPLLDGAQPDSPAAADAIRGSRAAAMAPDAMVATTSGRANDFASLAPLWGKGQQLAAAYADVLEGTEWPRPDQRPIVYHPRYNISFFGLEKLHPFDAGKFGKVVAALAAQGLVEPTQLVQPKEASLELLGQVHSQEYLYKIHHHNFTVVQVTELAALSLLPNKLLQWRVVSPMKLHVGGTVLAAGLALERGWAINLGGGMHHAAADRGMGWCPFDDIVLATLRARSALASANSTAPLALTSAASATASAAGSASVTTLPASSAAAKESPSAAGSAAVDAPWGSTSAARAAGPEATTSGSAPGSGSGSGSSTEDLVVLVVDLDAHQGNGVERDKLHLRLSAFHILDVYNARIFPRDEEAKPAIDIAVELVSGAGDETYLSQLDAALARAASELPRPGLVLYNAGTDVLQGDPLGRLGVSAAGVMLRDEAVWRWARDVARAPICMLLSGGYAPQSADVITASITNLFHKFDLGETAGGGGSEAPAIGVEPAAAGAPAGGGGPSTQEPPLNVAAV